MGIKGSKHLKKYVQSHACEAVPGVQHLGRSQSDVPLRQNILLPNTAFRLPTGQAGLTHNRRIFRPKPLSGFPSEFGSRWIR